MRNEIFVRALVFCGALLLAPGSGFAQEATLSGTVKDATGGVLPGVVVRAVHQATGNTFEAVTDAAGTYRLALRVGAYEVTAELAGFSVATQKTELLVGQRAVLNLEMSPAGLEEAVTVTSLAPLVNTTSAQVGTNIDPRQMQELPVQGRNWMDLALLAPAARRNESGGLMENRQGYNTILVDNQNVTVQYHSTPDSEQLIFSRDAIAEFQLISNQFDATYGQSAGQVVSAVTKSGTNAFDGTVSGYFRDDRFRAKDFVVDRVLPYSNQQMSVTFGGPIRRDREHFFGSYEYEREPKTFAYTTPYPSFNRDVHHTDRKDIFLGRGDVQFTPNARLSVRGSGSNWRFGSGGSATQAYGNFGEYRRRVIALSGNSTQVWSTRTVNEFSANLWNYHRPQNSIIRWKGGAFPNAVTLEGGSPIILLRGLTIGATPLFGMYDTRTLRDNLTTSYDWGGRHDLKVGGEYMWTSHDAWWCLRCQGQIDARGGPVPANIEELFPDVTDASTWNLAPLARITTKVVHPISKTGFRYGISRHLVAGWVQDDWKLADRFTLNLGLRYDFDTNANSERVRFLPWLPGDLPRDKNNFAPRLGLNYQVADGTVIRGGYGLFFAFAPQDAIHQTNFYTVVFENEYVNDGRPDFVPNWFGSGTPAEGEFGGGPKPTFEEALARACDQNHSAPGCIYRSLLNEISYPGRQTPYSHQASVGLQHELSRDMSVEVTYVYRGGRLEESESGQRNYNMTWNPATGANYPFSDISKRPFPDWGAVRFEVLEGWSNYHAAYFVFTKRFSRRWQANGSYTASVSKDADPCRDQWFIGDDGIVARRPLDFALVPDLTCEYTLADGDQRHRATINGVWDLGYGFQLSGIYLYGSGVRVATDTGLDLRGVGDGSSGRLRRDGTIMPRNALVGRPVHRVDVRVQKRVELGGVRLDGMVEAFNLFNHANYGSYVTNESSPRYGLPQFNGNVAYQPRTLQLGFRLAF